VLLFVLDADHPWAGLLGAGNPRQHARVALVNGIDGGLASSVSRIVVLVKHFLVEIIDPI
jgi:hypothetical protein